LITFLPLPNLRLSAIVLDRKRQGKQRLEVVDILNAMHDPSSRLRRHAAVRMWIGYTDALVAYGLAVCQDWIDSGCEDNQYDKILAFSTLGKGILPTQDNVVLLLWFGRESFHASHRGNLLRKNRRWYSAFGWKESPLLPYEWPVNIPLEVLIDLRRRGYEPLADGTSWPAANEMAKKIPGAIGVAACQCLYYPVKCASTLAKEDSPILSRGV
jgi:hypothetical protein